jgi:hypothetical protein
MFIRSALVALSALLFACSTPHSTVEGSNNSADTGPKGTKAATNDGDTPAATSGAADKVLDGTWDITSGDLAPSQITFSGGKITGTLIFADENLDSDDCVKSKNRVTFSLTVTGDKLSGSAQSELVYADPDSCGDGDHATVAINAKRSKSPSASAATHLEGDWVVSTDDGADPVEVTMVGMVGKLWNQQDKADGNEPGLAMTIDGKNASSDTASVPFAAKKR